jgi:PAS domain-containing protein
MDQLRLVIDTIPTLVWSCRPDGAFDYVSRRWSEYTGISAEDAMGSVGWLRIIPMTLKNTKKKDSRPW